MLALQILSYLLIEFSIVCSPHTIFDVDELSIQYGIEIKNKPVLLNSHPVDDENVLQLSSKHGQLYSCILPSLLPQVDEKESNKGTATESVIDILDKSLNGTCMTYKKGWWTYKLCHKKEITQYHVPELGHVSGPVTQLGIFSSEDDWTEKEVSHRRPSELFHSHEYVNGSICDVTQKPRKTVVQYFCGTNSKDEVIRIEEPATCEYIITVHNSKLCSHPLFSKKEKKKQVNLVCSPALIEHEFNNYMERLEKKNAKRAEMVLKAKMDLDAKYSAEANGFDKKDKPGKHKDKDPLIIDDSKGKKLKNENIISSFMKGFMKVLNIKSDDVKVTTKMLKGNQNIEGIMDELDLGEEDKRDSVREQTDKLDKDMQVDENPETKDVTDVKESEKLPEVAALSDLTSTMIKQLEMDSERMQHKAAKERKAMHIEFDRVRGESMKELERAKSLLGVLKSVKENTKVKSSQEHVESQLKSVQELVDSLQDQIKVIDEKRKTVDDLEEHTNKRLYDINQKIVDTKTIAKKLDPTSDFNNDFNNDEEDLDKRNSFQEKDEAKLPSKISNNGYDDDEEKKDEQKSQEKGDYEEIPQETPHDDENGISGDSKNKPSKLFGTMVTALKNEILKINQKLGKDKLSKNSDTTSKNEKAIIDNFMSKDKKEAAKDEIKSLNSIADTLKREMSHIRKILKNEKEKVSADARTADDEEREVIKESERYAKDNMEVRIRTIDDKLFEKDTDDDVLDEVKEATKKMEETVRKQLKDAGLDFKDNIKIKIITTKDKFDQFSDGKDGKLLSDDDAADFKDLLLGFLGGGKEKAKEERRQRTLEENYNFVANDDDLE